MVIRKDTIVWENVTCKKVLLLRDKESLMGSARHVSKLNSLSQVRVLPTKGGGISSRLQIPTVKYNNSDMKVETDT